MMTDVEFDSKVWSFQGSVNEQMKLHSPLLPKTIIGAVGRDAITSVVGTHPVDRRNWVVYPTMPSSGSLDANPAPTSRMITALHQTYICSASINLILGGLIGIVYRGSSDHCSPFVFALEPTNPAM